MERMTMVDVRNALRKFTEVASRVGYNTDGWSVRRGNQHYVLMYRRPDSEKLTPMSVGESARDAVASLFLLHDMAQDMLTISSPDRSARIMAIALRASLKLQTHDQTCTHCRMHLMGARPMWCDQRRHLLELWNDGLKLTEAILKQKLPERDILKYALSA